MAQSTCSVEACDRPIQNKARALCDPHYKRVWRYGDVQAHIPVPPKRKPVVPVRDFADGTRECLECARRLPLSGYHSDKQSPLGKRTRCKDCRTKAETARYHLDPESVRERVTAFRRANPELIRDREAKRYDKDKDKRLALAIAQSHVRRARIRNQGFERGVTVPALRKRDGDNCHYCKQVMTFASSARGNRPGNKATLEHKQAIARGGEHTFGNCVLACWSCNSAKGSKPYPDGASNATQAGARKRTGQA
jgi:5-methylcytosine-specific restriction endonuclease McrA